MQMVSWQMGVLVDDWLLPSSGSHNQCWKRHYQSTLLAISKLVYPARLFKLTYLTFLDVDNSQFIGSLPLAQAF